MKIKSPSFPFFFLLYFYSLNFSFAQSIKIIHTNDLHSFFKGTLEKKNGGVVRRGGYSRVATFVKNLRDEAKNEELFHLTLDAGDFYSGTIFHTLGMQASLPLFPEYEFFSNLEYDAVTLGNHEFDGKDAGFRLLMSKVKKLGNKVPIVSTNFRNNKNEDFPIVISKLKTLKIKNKEIQVGILGALGPDGCSVSQGNRIDNQFIGHNDSSRKEDWGSLIRLLSKEVKDLKNQGANIVILLLHGGGEEDEKLAKKVKGLDVIIAGHTHQNYFKKVDNVFIAQSGSYGRFVGELNIKKNENGLWSLISEKRHPITKEISPDHEVEERVSIFFRHIKNLFSQWGIYDFDSFDATKEKVFDKDYLKDENKTLGKFVMNQVLSSLKKTSNVQFYMGVRGLVRKPIYSNFPYGFNELFNILPLGFHNGHRPGYEVVSFYLKKEEFINLIDFLDLYGKFHPKAVPIFSSNLDYKVRKWGIPFINRIHSIRDRSSEIVDLPNLIPVATNSFLFSYLDLINKKTYGVIKILPRDSKGQPLLKGKVLKSEISYFIKSF